MKSLLESLLSIKMVPLFTIVSVLLGILNCFFGYRHLKSLLALIGFVTGVFLTVYYWGTVGSLFLFSVIAFIVGCLGAVVFFFGYYVFRWLWGPSFAYLLAVALTLWTGGEKPYPYLTGFLILLSLLSSWRFRKETVIVSTALTGSWMATAGILSMSVSHQNFIVMTPSKLPALASMSGGQMWLFWGAWLVFGLIGMAVQFMISKEKIENSDIAV